MKISIEIIFFKRHFHSLTIQLEKSKHEFQTDYHLKEHSKNSIDHVL
jgi:hypothetical protein